MEFTIIPVTPYLQNCSLVWDAAGRAALIDPGGEIERLLAEVATRGLTLEKILLTHGHLTMSARQMNCARGWAFQSKAPSAQNNFGSICCRSRRRCSAFRPRSRLRQTAGCKTANRSV